MKQGYASGALFRPSADGGCRICVVWMHAPLAQAPHSPQLAALWRRVPDALVELRLDACGDVSLALLARVLRAMPAGRCIVTFRSGAEGGGNVHATDGERQRYYALAVHLGAFAIDIELTSLQQHGGLHEVWHASGPCRRVASVHVGSAHAKAGVASVGGRPTAAALLRLRQAAEELGADVVKVAVAVDSMADCGPLIELATTPSQRGRPLIALATGAAGRWTRILAARWRQPAPWTYARLDAHPEAIALGLWHWAALHDVFRVGVIGSSTPVFGLVGQHVGASLSPALHNGWMHQLGLPGVYVPFVVDAPAHGARQFIQTFAPRLGVAGLSVTHPHKVAALEACCYAASARARRIGAANTLWQPRPNPAGGVLWQGDNTDAPAAIYCLRRLCGPQLRGRNILVLGAGGAARAVVWGAVRAGAQVWVWARQRAAAEALADRCGARVLPLQAPLQAGLGDAQARAAWAEMAAVVNCTPLGMTGPDVDDVPWPVAHLPPGCAVFDTVYRPARTRFLRQAATQGHRVRGGGAMFLHQARAQFAHFFGVAAPDGVMPLQRGPAGKAKRLR